MNPRTRLALPALALAGALALAACGSDDATGPSASEHGSAHDSSDGAQANDADLAFLTGMVPHHAQAVEMSELVLRSGPPAEVAAIAQQIKAAQEPEIEQMEAMLADLGESAEHGSHADSHGGMMSEQELAELEAATGTQAARLYLRAMIAHHEGAVEASDTEIAQGRYEPAITLARQIRQAQLAEIATLQELLDSL